MAMEYVGCICLEQKRHKFSTFRPDLEYFDQTAQNKKNFHQNVVPTRNIDIVLLFSFGVC